MKQKLTTQEKLTFIGAIIVSLVSSLMVIINQNEAVAKKVGESFTGSMKLVAISVSFVVMILTVLISALIYYGLYKFITKNEVSYLRMLFLSLLSSTPLLLIEAVLILLGNSELLQNKLFSGISGVLTSVLFVGLVYYLGDKKNDNRFFTFSCIIVGFSLLMMIGSLFIW